MGKRHFSRVIDVKSCDVSLKPMLIDFEHGNLVKEEVPKLRCEFLRSKDNEKDVFVMLKSKEAIYKYKGHKVDSDSQLCQRFFVIRNKRTNKIRVASIDQLIVSRYLENVVRHDEMNASQEIVSNEPQNLVELKKAFGSKRSQRGLVVDSRMNISTEMVEKKMQQTALSVNLDMKNSNNPPPSGSVLIPKCNRDATHKSDVYKLEDLFISSDASDSLTKVAQSVIDKCPVAPDGDYSQFFIDTLKCLKSITLDKVKCLLYVDALMRFIKLDAKSLKTTLKVYNICPLSRQLRTVIMDNFTEYSKSGRTRPLTMREKAICYIMVLLMIIFDYTLDREFVSLSVGSPTRRLDHIAAVLGFSKTTKNWVLKLPLVKVQPIQRGKKPRRE